MNSSLVVCLLVAAGMGSSFDAMAQSIDTQARRLVATCAGCHGTDGRAQGGAVPALAGRNKDELLAQLQAFRNGSRPATVMHQLAKGYTPEQLDAIAAYLASQRK